jgi:hypothetical protein
MLTVTYPNDEVFQKMDLENYRCRGVVHHRTFYATIHAILVVFYLHEEIVLISNHCIQPI